MALRLADQFDDEGNPSYFLQGEIVVVVRHAPDELRRPEEKS
jgi:hypothetical protein